MPYVARAWVEPDTGAWGPVRRLLTAYVRLGYLAQVYGMGWDVVLVVTGPSGTSAPSRPPRTPAPPGDPVVVVAGAARVLLAGGRRPSTVDDAGGETWTVAAVTGIWRRPGTVPPAAVRTAWRVRLTCWHTPPPGTPAVVEQLGDLSWRLRPPR